MLHADFKNTIMRKARLKFFTLRYFMDKIKN